MNLLTDGLFVADRQALTLPEVLAKLSVDDILSFDELRPHQQHGLYAFLVQLAAMALHRAGSKDIPGRMETWFELWSDMTKWQEEPWSLVVGDLTKPAFLQPPIPEGSLDCFNKVKSPDEMDSIQTGVGIDIKPAVMANPTPGHWVLMLINLQTMSNNLGRGNYNIVRMYGGNGCRPCVTFAPDFQLGSRFRRDLPILLKKRAMIAREYGYKKKGGIELLWTLPWDGQSALELSECDPYFIEICRRVRLVQKENRIIGMKKGTGMKKDTPGMRVDAKHLCGIVGDPWAPIDTEGEKSFTASVRGFPYKLLVDLLMSRKFKPGITQEVQTTDDKELLFYVWAVPGGQGKPGGYHERAIPIPGYACKLIMSEDERDRLFTVSTRRLTTVVDVISKVLKPAICTLIQGGPEKLDLTDSSSYIYINRFEAVVDQEFFPHLWEGLLEEEEVAQKNWARWLLAQAYECLQQAKKSFVVASVSYYRAVAKAEMMFGWGQNKHFPKKKEEEVEETQGEALRCNL